MEYLKLTAIMKEKNGQLAGIVSFQKINGDVILDWSIGQLSPNDELIFTMKGGKKLQFASLAKRGKKKVFNACSEFKCEMMRGGRTVATGMTSKYVQNDMDVINYVNKFANNAKTVIKVSEVEEIEKIGDVFDGKVATYNYYENELPKCVANDASAIVNSFENKTAVQTKTLVDTNIECNVEFDDTAKIETKKQPKISKDENTDKIEERKRQDVEDSTDQIFGGLPKDEKKSDRIVKPSDKTASPTERETRPSEKPSIPKKKTDEKDIRTDKINQMQPRMNDKVDEKCDDDDLSFMEINEQNSEEKNEQEKQDIEDSTDQIFGGLPRNEKGKDEVPNENKGKEKESKKKQMKAENESKDDCDEEEITKKWNEDNSTFYETIKEQLDDLFAKFPKDTYLNEIIPSSKWAKVTYDESGRTYSVGILTDGEDVLFVGYGVIAEYSQEPPKELNQNAQWVPLNFAKPHGKGYWMLYQSAKDGTNV